MVLVPRHAMHVVVVVRHALWQQGVDTEQDDGADDGAGLGAGSGRAAVTSAAAAGVSGGSGLPQAVSDRQTIGTTSRTMSGRRAMATP